MSNYFVLNDNQYQIIALDDYFGRHEYGYIVKRKIKILWKEVNIRIGLAYRTEQEAKEFLREYKKWV